MRIRFARVFWVLLTAAIAAPAAAQPPTNASTTMTATVTALAKLTVSSAALTFPDANPDLVPQLTPVQGALSITAKARATGGSQVLLTVQAGDDLRSGLDVIPASAITWTTTGAGFTPGTLSRLVPVAVGTWTGSGAWTGTQTFAFSNSWTYSTGTYTCVLVYTLSGP
jgi:hypothetical protein